MKNRIFGLLSVVVVSALAHVSAYGDDHASPSSEPSPSPEETAAPPKKAENIDLKKVVDEPLPLPEETPKAAIDIDLQAEVLDAEDTLNITKPLPQGIEEESVDATQTDGDEGPAKTAQTLEEQIDEAVEQEVTAEPEISAVTPSPEAVESSEPNIIEKIAQELKPKEPGPTPKAPLVLLNSEVPPGTSTRLGWSPSISFMGISAPTAVLVLNGVKTGPTLCLTAAVHGDELNGIEIVRRVLYNIDPETLSGAVIGVPIVNLQGFRRSSRYLPDRRDLNRFFPGNPGGSSAARIAHSFFTEVITHCDFLVDLHTGSFRRTNLPQIRADLSYPEVASLTKKMGSIVVVQSDGAVGSLRRAAVESGIPAITLEAGAPLELQKDAVEYGVKSVETAMDGLGMIDRRRFWERATEPVYYQSMWVRAKEGGILFSEVALGAYVKEGQLLGAITDPITNTRSEVHAPFDGRVIGMALNQVMFPGFAAYHVGLRASVEEAAQEKTVLSEVDSAAVETASEASTDEGSASEPEGSVAGESDAVSQEEPIEDSE